MKYFYNPPLLIKKIFGKYHWSTNNNKILLTFDDGPIENNTVEILNLLNKYNIKALFFLVGGNCQKHPELIKEILSEGHLIGNHTFNHARITKLDNSEIKEEITKLNRFVYEQFGYKMRYFRPPHGRFTPGLQKILDEMRMECVLWTLLTFDYKNDINLVKLAVNNYLRSDSIVVMHDSLKSKDIIKESISYLSETIIQKKLSYGAPEECLK